MTVNEIVLRVFRAHWQVLVACTAVPPLLVVALAVLAAPTYTSEARVQGGTVLPGSETEADALLNLVKGVATSRAGIEAALDATHTVGRDPAAVAAAVDVSRMGSSAVLRLSVTDGDPATATALSGAVAAHVLDYLNNAGDARTANLLDGLENRQRELLDDRQKTAAALSLTRDPVQSADGAARLAGIDQQLSDLASTMRQLQLGGTSAGSSGSASLVSPAAPATPAPTALVSRSGLALVAGLVVGLLAATILEMIRPHVADARSFAQERAHTVVGLLPRTGRHAKCASEPYVDPVQLESESIIMVRRAAQRAGVERVAVVGPVAPERLRAVRVGLRKALIDNPPRPLNGQRPQLPDAALEPAALPGPGEASDPRGLGTLLLHADPEPAAPARARPDVCTLDDVPVDGPADDYGLLLVVPVLAPRAELRRMADLEAATGWPVVGVLADPDRARAASGRRRRRWIGVSR